MLITREFSRNAACELAGFHGSVIKPIKFTR
jgi:hypothetical protein